LQRRQAVRRAARFAGTARQEYAVNILSGKDPIGALKGRWRHLLIYTAVGLLGIAVFLFVAFRLLHVSTNTAKVLLLKGPNGLHLTTKEPLGRTEDVVIRIDATPLFNTLFENIAGASTYSLVDSNYDPMEGKGIIKEFRPDVIVLSAFLLPLGKLDSNNPKFFGKILLGQPKGPCQLGPGKHPFRSILRPQPECRSDVYQSSSR